MQQSFLKQVVLGMRSVERTPSPERIMKQLNSCINMLVAITKISSQSETKNIDNLLEEASNKPLGEPKSLEAFVKTLIDVVKKKVCPSFVTLLQK